MTFQAAKWARRTTAWALCLAVAWALAPPQPEAFDRSFIVIPYSADGYSYKIGPHDHSDGFEARDFDDVFFETGSAPFGRGPAPGRCSLDTSVRTKWPINTDLVVRKSFYLPMAPRNLYVEAAIDNDLQVFINGVDVSFGMQRFSGCARRGQYKVRVRDDILKVGTNILAVRARDRGVDSFFDVQVTADFEWI